MQFSLKKQIMKLSLMQWEENFNFIGGEPEIQNRESWLFLQSLLTSKREIDESTSEF